MFRKNRVSIPKAFATLLLAWLMCFCAYGQRDLPINQEITNSFGTATSLRVMLENKGLSRTQIDLLLKECKTTNILPVSTVAELDSFRVAVNKGLSYWYLQSKSSSLTLYLVADPQTAQVKLGADLEITSWTPIGTSSNPFKGAFNGNNHTITFKNVSTDVDNFGLFGYIGGAITNKYTTFMLRAI